MVCDGACRLSILESDARTWVDVVRGHAERTPAAIAFTFLVDGEEDEEHLTFGELDRRARSVAVALRDAGYTGRRVLLLYPPGLDFIVAFVGCLYARVVAVPVYPPDPFRLERTVPRLSAISESAGALAILTTRAMVALAPVMLTHAPELAALPLLATDAFDDAPERWNGSDATCHDVAFLQYTSGSTASPKGVVITHRNATANVRMMAEVGGHDRDTVIVSWLPAYHDLGLIGAILHPLHLGARSVLFSPIAFIERPMRWPRALARHRATVTAAPNFAFDLCVRKSTPAERAKLDLSALRMLMAGAEPINPTTLRRFAEAFGSSGLDTGAFFIGYGLAEATLSVSAGWPGSGLIRSFSSAALSEGRLEAIDENAGGAREVVSCGWPLPHQRVLVVDPESHVPCEPGRVGEVWVSGPNVASGYWNRPEETDATFAARLATGEGPFLRTGDLGAFHASELLVVGRRKDLIIVNGRNHAPQDIEWTVQRAHPKLSTSSAAAFAVARDGAEELVVVAELPSSVDAREAEEVERAARRAVAREHDLRLARVVFVAAKSLPKTSSGKLKRSAARDAYMNGSLDVSATAKEGTG
ncbi:Non-ribosomal peptide synthase [Minicystis rosea]|nr:Non-ribosomal peptide synthase [Minicystis rosea]